MGSPLNQILVQGIGQFDEPTPRYTTVQDVHRYLTGVPSVPNTVLRLC